MSPLFFIDVFCSLIWFTIGIQDFYSLTEEETEFSTNQVNNSRSSLNVKELVDEYVDSKTKTDNVRFELKDDVVRCVSQEYGITWTLSDNGIVPESVVSRLENKGFSNLDSPKYNVTILPVEIAEEKDGDMISDCQEWYLDMESAEPITDYESKDETS